MVEPAFGFGTGSFGAMPFGTSEDQLESVQAAASVAENRIRVTFLTAPLMTGLEIQNDALDPSYYSLAPGLDTVDRQGNVPRAVSIIRVVKVDDLTVDLLLDRPMSSYPSGYELTVDGLVAGIDNQPFALQTFVIMAQFKGIPVPTKDLVINSRDVANPQNREALYDPLPIDGTPTEPLGNWAVDSKGDVAFDEGLVSYKKRVYRRLTTRKGAYAHLGREYGALLAQSAKQLSIPAFRDVLAIDAEDQIRQEPETVEVSVVIRPDVRNPEIHYFVIRARTTAGSAAFQVPVVAGN